MIATATTELETAIVSQACRHVGRRLSSAELGVVLTHMIGERMRAGQATRILAVLIRLAIKANPYAPAVDALFADHARTMQAWAGPHLAGLLRTIEACRAVKLPVPVVVSCEAYLPKARRAQQAIGERYFGIEPIVLRGNGGAVEESLDGSVLCVPADDSYEALPTKIFGLITLLEALGADSGLLKLDDDLQVLPGGAAELAALQATFATADYLGTALASPHHDRAWHFGKCRSPVPALYGKPFRAPWARGALYYLSGRALRVLARQVIRFPGCIEGEIYEDKIVGDILHEAGVGLINCPLEPRLGVSTDAPERSLVAAA